MYYNYMYYNFPDGLHWKELNIICRKATLSLAQAGQRVRPHTCRSCLLLSLGKVWDVCAPGPQESEGAEGSSPFMGLPKKGIPWGTAWKSTEFSAGWGGQAEAQMLGVPYALYWRTSEWDAIPFCASVSLPIHDKVGVLGVCSLNNFSSRLQYIQS